MIILNLKEEKKKLFLADISLLFDHAFWIDINSSITLV